MHEYAQSSRTHQRMRARAHPHTENDECKNVELRKELPDVLFREGEEVGRITPWQTRLRPRCHRFQDLKNHTR